MNANPDRYLIPARRAEAQTLLQRSRFLAVAAPVARLSDAQAVLEGEKKRWHDASHHCFAWKVEREERHSDDGEPSGTAGKPIATAIIQSGLDLVVVVVSRYFGGVKLGPAGLARAYGDAAKEALSQAGAQECFRTVRIIVRFEFDLTSPVHRALELFEAHTVESSYGERARLVVDVRASRADAFKSALTESTAGRAELCHA